MHTLKWQRIADSDGTTVMYTAVAGQPAPRQPYTAYRVKPRHIDLGRTRPTVAYYEITLWDGARGEKPVGCTYTLAEAKRASQDHHSATQAHV